MDDTALEPFASPPRAKKVRELTDKERRDIAVTLSASIENGRLPHGILTKVARQHSVARPTVSILWKQTSLKLRNGLSMSSASMSRKYLRHKPFKYNLADVADHVPTIPLSQRGTVRDLAMAINIPKSTIHRYASMGDDGPLRFHSSALKPTLTEENKLSRVMFCLDKIGENGLYKDLYDEVHLDEKWFYMTWDHSHYILATGESDPHGTTRHKGHVEKVMFLSAVARPRWDSHRKCNFNGKIGIWPIAEKFVAKRNSIRRPAGTALASKNLPMVPMVPMDRRLYREVLIQKVLPAIKEKFPAGDLQNMRLTLQQDNAPAHVAVDDAAVTEEIARLGLNLKLVNQPPNSPDLNINDLAFFRSLQTKQFKNPSYNIDELVTAVHTAFDEYETYKLNHAFLTLQCCFNSIIVAGGDNDYKVTHMGKAELEREGLLPVSIRVTGDADQWNTENEDHE